MRAVTRHKPKLRTRRRARIPKRPVRLTSSRETFLPIAEAFDRALELDAAWRRVFATGRYREVAAYFDSFV